MDEHTVRWGERWIYVFFLRWAKGLFFASFGSSCGRHAPLLELVALEISRPKKECLGWGGIFKVFTPNVECRAACEAAASGQVQPAQLAALTCCLLAGNTFHILYSSKSIHFCVKNCSGKSTSTSHYKSIVPISPLLPTATIVIRELYFAEFISFKHKSNKSVFPI